MDQSAILKKKLVKRDPVFSFFFYILNFFFGGVNCYGKSLLGGRRWGGARGECGPWRRAVWSCGGTGGGRDRREEWDS